MDNYLDFLAHYITDNKARGMVAELSFAADFASPKLLAGGWMISPQHHHDLRVAVFVLPRFYRDQAELDYAVAELVHERAWQALAFFLTSAGIGTIVSGCTGTLEGATWRHYRYQAEMLVPTEGDAPFDQWPGNRGRASTGSAWSPTVLARFADVEAEALTALVLRQAFYYAYLKGQLKKPLADPYDVDSYLVSYTGRVIPLEIKEKSRTPTEQFGIDAGRILMLLRLCLATDSNALYVIREIANDAERSFIGWQAITLADLILTCSWNLQAGGRGMGGGATQTVMLPASAFQPFAEGQLQETWLVSQASLSGVVRQQAAALYDALKQWL